MAANYDRKGHQKSSKGLASNQNCLRTPINSIIWNLYYKQDDEGNNELHKVLSNPQQNESMVLEMISLAPYSWLLNMVNNKGETPLHIAIKNRSYKLVRILSLYGADPRIKNNLGHNALHHICLSDDIGMLRVLMDPPSDDDEEYYYDKPWAYSATVMASCLEERSALGETPLHIAVILNNIEMARLLLQYGSDVNARTYTCALTPLHIAVQKNNQRIVELLLNYNANVNVRTFCTMSVYDVARHADPIIRKMLRNTGAVPTPKEYSDDDSGTDFDFDALEDSHERMSG